MSAPAMPIHIHPTYELAPRVLLPGDPGRALALAQHLLEGPRMFNHHRGLWGYTGVAADGELLTVQATGMGGPSAAIVLEELCDLGARTAIRVGTCGALSGDLAHGDLVGLTAAIAADGTSRALGAGERILPDPALTEGLLAAGARPGVAVSTDVFYERAAGRGESWRAAGADVVEMEAATLLRVGELRGIAVGALVAVTDLLGRTEDDRRRLEDEGLEALVAALGGCATAALGIPARESAPARGLVDPELEAETAARAADRSGDAPGAPSAADATT